MKYIKLLILIISICFISCESMDDTYSDQVNKTKERYLGKCSNLSIEKGWNRIKLNWDNPVDPCVEKIKIKWSTEETTDSVFVEKDVTTYTTEAELENKNYEFTICCVDENGNESLNLIGYTKPFTKDDELINLLKIIEKKYFFVEDRLIVFLHEKSDNILSATINFSQNGETQSHIITEEDFQKAVLSFDNVDKDKPITIQTSVSYEECIDDVDFEPYELSNEMISMNSDFINNLKIINNMETIENDFLPTITTLYINRDLMSLEDILYLPNLEKIVIGNKKFLIPWCANPGSKYFLSLQEKEKSIFALKNMQELKGIEIEVYADNFGLKGTEGLEITEMPNPTVPQIAFFPEEEMNQWEITCDSELSYDSDYKYLLDQNNQTFWKPLEVKDECRRHNLIIDMKEQKDLHGILFRQMNNNKLVKYIPSVIEIYISEDGVDWELPFKYIDIELGASPAESKLIEFSEVKRAQYVKLVVSDQISRRNNYVVIGDFIPY